MHSIAPPGRRTGFVSVRSAPAAPRPPPKVRMRSSPLRLSPSAWQVLALDAAFGAAAIGLAMLLRFVDEGSIPATYTQRLVPWLFAAAAVQVAAGELINRLRKPGSALARRPVAP